MLRQSLRSLGTDVTDLLSAADLSPMARAEDIPIDGFVSLARALAVQRALRHDAGALARGGKVVVTKLLGGNFTIASAMFGIKAMTIEGTLTGTLAEARELLDLARARNIAPIPTRNRPLGKAQAALDDLRAGRIVGRTVLTA